ncbi:hypothetical protein HN011_000004 [Eciton burchellii]|nr:hypothetical protein HN011_000004 [Eciton burchellii]
MVDRFHLAAVRAWERSPSVLATTLDVDVRRSARQPRRQVTHWHATTTTVTGIKGADRAVAATSIPDGELPSRCRCRRGHDCPAIGDEHEEMSGIAKHGAEEPTVRRLSETGRRIPVQVRPFCSAPLVRKTRSRFTADADAMRCDEPFTRTMVPSSSGNSTKRTP